MAKKKIQSFAHLDVDPTTISLAEASAWVMEQHKKGAVCPACHQLAKRYKRKLNSSMAYALLLIYRHFKTHTEWLHVPEYLEKVCNTGPTKRGGDWAKMVHWGLIVSKDDETRADGSKRVGFYKITQKGIDFVRGRIRVPKHAFIYAQKCIAMSPEDTSISEALGDRFNYSELMAS
jgi:hypothetical protein